MAYVRVTFEEKHRDEIVAHFKIKSYRSLALLL
jgi:hypothetical protein